MKLQTKLTSSLLSLLMSSCILYANESNNTTDNNLKKLPPNYDMIVAYYGRPHVKSLGILGNYSLQEIIPKIKAKAKEYEDALNHTHKVTAGFDLIYELATKEAGKDGKYVIKLPDATLQKYIKAANDNGMVLFIDVQLGKQTPQEAIKPLLKYLNNPSVHIAIDPEFSIDDLSVNPGEVIGAITGEQINAVQKMMSDYLKEHHISDDKILLIHMFTQNMVTHKKAIRYTDKIHLVMHLDGHGSPALKINVYNGLYTDARAAKVSGAFKVFLKQDNPIMTPKQVLGLESVEGKKVKDMPKVITYQ